MLTLDDIVNVIPQALAGVDIPELGQKRRGKVRDMYVRDGRRFLITTDRISAFDRVLGLIPYKGQVLTQLSAFWFERTADVVANHLLAVPDPNVLLGRECRPFPVEIIVRGYITGVTTTSLWYDYQRGERVIYGHRLPDGLRKNDPLPQPVITPTTKAEGGAHDERLTRDEIVERRLVDGETYERLEQAALALFARGQEVCRRAGLILVDTKYEFGQAADGTIVLIDEVHTPDSSRFWRAASYEQRLSAGQEPENFDKEFLRLWFAGQGYRGEGPIPAMPDEFVARVSERYIRVYEMITGRAFQPGAYPAGPRIAANVRAWLEHGGDY